MSAQPIARAAWQGNALPQWAPIEEWPSIHTARAALLFNFWAPSARPPATRPAGQWPYSYNTCGQGSAGQAWSLNAPQTLSACPDPPGFNRTKWGMAPGLGRGAPEFDVFEVRWVGALGVRAGQVLSRTCLFLEVPSGPLHQDPAATTRPAPAPRPPAAAAACTPATTAPPLPLAPTTRTPRPPTPCRWRRCCPRASTGWTRGSTRAWGWRTGSSSQVRARRAHWTLLYGWGKQGMGGQEGRGWLHCTVQGLRGR